MKNIKVSYRITTKGGGWSKFNSIEGAITYYKKLYIQGIKRQILIKKFKRRLKYENKKLQSGI